MYLYIIIKKSQELVYIAQSLVDKIKKFLFGLYFSSLIKKYIWIYFI